MTRLLITVFLIATLGATVASAEAGGDSSTPVLDRYYAIKAELAGLIAQRHKLEAELSNERRAIVQHARANDEDPRDALLQWRANRSADFMLQEQLRRELFENAAAMRDILIEYNDIQRPESNATDAERREFREVEDQIRFTIVETVKHYQRQAAGKR